MTGKIQQLVKLNEFGNRVGDSHGRSKFSDSEIEEMRRLFEQGWSAYAIAKKFEAHRGYVSRVVHYQRRCATAFKVVAITAPVEG